MFVTKDNIDNAVKLIQLGADGSNVNAQARQTAKAFLLQAAQELTDFGNLKPGTYPARVCFDRAVELRKVASTVELPR